MNRPSNARRTLLALAIALPAPLLVACPKKENPVVVDAGPPPPPPMEAAVVDLTPIVEDAGPDVVEASAPRYGGTPTNTMSARIKQCCNAIRAQAKALGSSPEGNMILAAAASCDGLAAQAAATNNAPEFTAVKSLMQGKPLPAVCQGL
jgi:hypothetical protein